MNKFKKIFGNTKPIIAMLHLNEDMQMSMMERARLEIKTYYENGVDAVLVEDYFGTPEDCETVLAYLQKEYPDKIYGVNILANYTLSLELAKEYGAKFIQIDSVCGHYPPTKDKFFESQLKTAIKDTDVAVLGGVRFKYQPVYSGRSLEEDLFLGSERCDAIVVTGDGTGEETPMQKMCEFRSVLGDFPLIAGAGVTAETVKETLNICDGVIVGSWLKEHHDAACNVKKEYVKTFTASAKE